MKTTVTQEEFEAFLKLLDPDRDKAGLKYEAIQLRLIKYFYARGCPPAEELADKSIDRAIKKIYEMDDYNGDPALYCFGVAKYVFLEFAREPDFEELKETAIAQINIEIPEEDSYKCYLNCLKQLPTNQSSLITQYYAYKKGEKTQIRRGLESDLNLTNAALRTKITRIKTKLQLCVEKCKK